MGTIQLILICAAILTLCVAGMAITIIVKKDGKFPETEIGRNENMRKLGIRCMQDEERMLWHQARGMSPDEAGCSVCSCVSDCIVHELKDKKRDAC